MRIFWVIGMLMCCTSLVFSQGSTLPCTPATNLTVAGFGIFPESLNGVSSGLPTADTICLNHYFEQTFTIKTPKASELPDWTAPLLPLLSLGLNQTSWKLPTGIEIACNPPNCTFPLGTTGCLVVKGVPTALSDLNGHALDLDIVLRISGVEKDTTALKAHGFSLFFDSDGPYCRPANVNELAATQLQMRNTPNPFGGETVIEVQSGIRGRFDFRIYDLTGKLMYRQPVQLFRGENRINFNGELLPNGLYVFALTDGLHSVARKMVIHH